MAALLADLLEHLVHVGRLDLGHRALHRDPLVALEFDFGQNLEGRRERQVGAGGVLLGLDPGPADRPELVLGDGLVPRGLDYLGDDLITDVRAVTLADDL